MCLGQPAHGKFCRAVNAQAGRAVNPCSRTGVEHAAARFEVREACADTVDHPCQVDRNHPVDIRVLHILDRTASANARIIEQHVDRAAAMRRKIGECGFPLRAVGHVEFVDRPLTGGQHGRGFLQARLIHIGQPDEPAAFGKIA